MVDRRRLHYLLMGLLKKEKGRPDGLFEGDALNSPGVERGDGGELPRKIARVLVV